MFALSKTSVCCLPLAGIAASNPTGGMDVLFIVNVVCFQVEISATGQSLVQRRPTECVCVCVCVSVSVVRCNNNPLHLQWVDSKRAE